jgi:hypothetical protein
MNGIQRIKSMLGVTWAAACILILLATFIGLNFWSETLANGTGVHVSPHFSGGEVRQTIDHGVYKTLLHRMVFDGLLSERSKGFVQIDWVPPEKQSLPAVLEEHLDIDGDGATEIGIRLDTVGEKAELIQAAPWVIGLEPLVSIDSECILRVRLRNPRR